MSDRKNRSVRFFKTLEGGLKVCFIKNYNLISKIIKFEYQPCFYLGSDDIWTFRNIHKD